MKRILVFLLAIVMVMALFVGCSKDTGDTSDKTADNADIADNTDNTSDQAPETKETPKVGEGQKVLANDSETLNLDWWAGIGTDSKFESPYRDLQSLYPFMIFDTLIKMDPYDISNTSSDVLKYHLATNIDVSDDGLTYTFTIRDGVKWTDGEPFTAEDVKFSYLVNLKLTASMYAANMVSISGAQDVIDGKADDCAGLQVDGNKFTVKLDKPYVDIIPQIFAVLLILPEHCFTGVDPLEFEDNLDFWKRPIGLGPWMIDKVSFPNYFTMVQNPYWYGEPANIQNITFTSHVTGGVDATIADLIAGNIDYAYGNGVNDITQAQNVVDNNPDMQIFVRPSNYQRMLVFNGKSSNDGQRNEFMDDKRVRQAINMIIDKAAVAAMYGDTGTPLTTACLPDNPWYNTSITPWERDVDAAKALLDEAGYDYSKAIRIVYYYNEQTTKDIMDIFVQNFAEAGITLAPFLATGDLSAILYDVRNWDVMYCGDFRSNPIYQYGMLQTSELYDKYMGDSDVRDNEFQPLFNQFKQTSDPKQRKEIGDQIQEWALDNCYQVPVYGLSRITIVNTQKLEFDTQIFLTDESSGFDWLWSTWNLIKYE